jgi:hypothetical protein
VDVPSWEAVYAFFVRWNERGLPQGLVKWLRGRLRTAWGRPRLPGRRLDRLPVVKAADKAADTVGAESRGDDAGNVVLP